VDPVVVNLTNKNLSFRLRPEGKEYYLNDVNVIGPYERYVIPRNMHTGKAFLFDQLTEEVLEKDKTTGEEVISMKPVLATIDESRSDRKGSYFTFSFVPESGPGSFSAKFKKATVSCREFVIVSEPYQKKVEEIHKEISGWSSFSAPSEGAEGFSFGSEQAESFSFGSGPQVSSFGSFGGSSGSGQPFSSGGSSFGFGGGFGTSGGSGSSSFGFGGGFGTSGGGGDLFPSMTCALRRAGGTASDRE